MAEEPLGASFRDPSGFVFERAGVLYRRIHRSYLPHYEQLMGSGLYDELVRRGLLVPHAEAPECRSEDPNAALTIRPERVPFVSYPYEWCFSQLKDAAAATLRVQQLALEHGMTLKDASAYNIQLHGGRPMLIDTLSFEKYVEGAPWVAYRQFCQHFLAPLALMAHRDVRLGQLLRVHIDGIPLDLARTLLPTRAWLNVHLLAHIRVHARYQRRYEGATDARERARPMSRRSLGALITALELATRRLEWRPERTQWSDYYAGDSYSAASAEHKRQVVSAYLDRIDPTELWDLGANTGEFSRIASDRGTRTVAFDVDPACVEHSYRRVREAGEKLLLPLLLDLTNPSPALGWANRERSTLLERRSADAVMALALIHHLAIANNVPLGRIARIFADLADELIVEFVPKSDAKVRILLATREDIFPDYTREGFEAAFREIFEICEATPINDSERRLYRMRRRGDRPLG